MGAVIICDHDAPYVYMRVAVHQRGHAAAAVWASIGVLELAAAAGGPVHVIAWSLIGTGRQMKW